MIARFNNEFINRGSQSTIVYIIKTESKLDILRFQQQRQAGYLLPRSKSWFDFYTLRANIYYSSSEMDFCSLNIAGSANYRHAKILGFKSLKSVLRAIITRVILINPTPLVIFFEIKNF